MGKRKIEIVTHLYPTYDGLIFFALDVRDKKTGDVFSGISADVTDDELKTIAKTIKKTLKERN